MDRKLENIRNDLVHLNSLERVSTRLWREHVSSLFCLSCSDLNFTHAYTRHRIRMQTNTTLLAEAHR